MSLYGDLPSAKDDAGNGTSKGWTSSAQKLQPAQRGKGVAAASILAPPPTLLRNAAASGRGSAGARALPGGGRGVGGINGQLTPGGGGGGGGGGADVDADADADAGPLLLAANAAAGSGGGGGNAGGPIVVSAVSFLSVDGAPIEDEYDPSRPNDYEEEVARERERRRRAAEEEAERVRRRREADMAAGGRASSSSKSTNHNSSSKREQAADAAASSSAQRQQQNGSGDAAAAAGPSPAAALEERERRLKMSGDEAFAARARLSSGRGAGAAEAGPSALPAAATGAGLGAGLGAAAAAAARDEAAAVGGASEEQGPASGGGKGGGMGFAEKMLRKMGWRDGEGLGRNRQGMATPLMAQKRGDRAGIIVPTPSDRPRPAFDDPGPPEKRARKSAALVGRPSRVLALRNMVGPGEVDGDLEEEVGVELSKHGEVRDVRIFEVTSAGYDAAEAVRIFVQFDSADAAVRASIDLQGRFFGGRPLRVAFFDEGRFDRGDLAPAAGEFGAEGSGGGGPGG